MSNPSELKTFLEQRAALMRKIHPNLELKYGGFEELVLEYGIEMESSPLPKGMKPGLPKACYWNCQQLMYKRKNLIYVEGYALDMDISFPLSHAWLMTKDKKVIDPTWRNSNIYYLGVPLSTEWVKTILKSRMRNGEITNLSIFEGNYLEGHSLLKQGLPAEALAYFDQQNLKSQDTSDSNSSLA